MLPYKYIYTYYPYPQAHLSYFIVKRDHSFLGLYEEEEEEGKEAGAGIKQFGGGGGSCVQSQYLATKYVKYTNLMYKLYNAN